MEILVVDPLRQIEPKAEPAFRAKGWKSTVTADRWGAFTGALKSVPDVVILHGDGVAGQTVHVCQRFKHNPFTVGIPLVLVEDVVPPTWLLTGLPVDAVAQSPWEPDDLIHQIEMLSPTSTATELMDDLTNFPRRRSVLNEMERRMLTRELFAGGLLTLREADAYRQDYGRTGLDHFVVLLSVILRRNAAGLSPVTIGYLDEGSFLVLGASTTVHEIVASTIRDFETLVPAYYEMDSLFKDPNQQTGAATWIGVQGALCLVEPDRFDNALQVGFVLAETLAAGNEVVRQATTRVSAHDTSQVAAD